MSTKGWRRALVRAHGTIAVAIQRLNDSAVQIALVIRDGGILEGTVTDGDVRRGLLAGMSLQSPAGHGAPSL